MKTKRKCLFCQGTQNIVSSKGKKGFEIFIDDNYLCYEYFDVNKKVGGGGAKKINYCPFCGKKLTSEISKNKTQDVI